MHAKLADELDRVLTLMSSHLTKDTEFTPAGLETLLDLATVFHHYGVGVIALANNYSRFEEGVGIDLHSRAAKLSKEAGALIGMIAVLTINEDLVARSYPPCLTEAGHKCLKSTIRQTLGKVVGSYENMSLLARLIHQELAKKDPDARIIA